MASVLDGQIDPRFFNHPKNGLILLMTIDDILASKGEVELRTRLQTFMDAPFTAELPPEDKTRETAELAMDLLRVLKDE